MGNRIALRTSLLIILMSVFTASYAQRGNTAWKKYRHEISGGYGVNTVFASLGENDKFHFNYVFQRSTMNASYRYFLLKKVAVRGSFTHAFARKNDKEITPGEIRTNARLDYISTISEFGALAEYHFFDETTKGRKGKVRRARGGMSKGVNVGLSLFGGVALDYLRPFGEYYGERVVFKPITDPLTVPNNAKYNKMNVHFPVGANLRFVLTENWRVGFEAGYRLGIRNYINGASGVYYVDETVSNPDYQPEEGDLDPQLISTITFEKENAPLDVLVDSRGRKNYFFGLLTVSYRLKL